MLSYLTMWKDFFKNNFHYLTLALSMLASFVLMLKYFWIADDAFISFRFAKNFALGEGLRFNIANEVPVEGYSNLLWVLVAAFFEFFGIPSYQIVPYLSMPLGLILIWKVYASGITYFQLSKESAAFAASTVALCPAIIIWGSSGLEPIPFALIIFLVFEYLFLKKEAKLAMLCLYGFGLCLIRAEGALWAVTFCILAIIFLPDRRALAFKFLMFLIATIIIYTFCRYSYYHEMSPNTASAKLGMSLARLQRGFNYITVFCLTFLLPLIAILVPLLKLNLKIFLVFICYLGFFAYSVLTGGDYMAMGRFLIPAIAFQALLLGVLFERARLLGRLAPIILCLFFIILSVCPFTTTQIVTKSIRSNFHFRLNDRIFLEEIEQWKLMKENSIRWRHVGEKLKSLSTPGDSLVEGAIGNIGYFSELYIYDRLGLCTKLSSKFQQKTLRSPGHDLKAPLEYFTIHKPTFLYANLQKPDKFQRVKELKAHFPYAPFMYPTDFKPNKRYEFILFKRAVTPEEYEKQWATLRAWIDA